MATVPATLVLGAGRSSLPFGLFSQVSFRPTDRFEVGVQWEALTCEPAGGIASAFADEPPALGLPKTLDSNGTNVYSAAAFTVYGHFNASPTAYTPEMAQERAIEHLQAREEARVEQAFWTGDLDNTPTLRDSTFEAAAASVKIGLALLEEYNASEFGSLGVIHLTRAAAQFAASEQAVYARGGQLSTALGTPVIAGAGYDGSGPTGAAAPGAAERWAYVTPPLFGYRTEVFTSSGRPGDLLDRGVNDLYAIAERTYVLGYDTCSSHAIRLSLTA